MQFNKPDAANWSSTVRRLTCDGFPKSPDNTNVKHLGIADIIVEYPEGTDMVKQSVSDVPIWYKRGYLLNNDSTYIMELVMRLKTKLKLRPAIPLRDIRLYVHNFRAQ